ncbi:hypothetical protein [Paraburkholderia aspalathi]|uniref:Uncharacterized protein n=1 Tax=Paraburkholderia aspalathi TaxID=1324617 RepID=A0A1I7ACK3_9BURK|nr:hypothetical protein [Paraburkholderia aspalathi]SFT72613.1 hypothetical protein SAMN05192563_1003263 [Paraburkholderia aspalathi]
MKILIKNTASLFSRDRSNNGRTRLIILVLCICLDILLLQGCSNPQAPEPKANPDPRVTSHVKITVEEGSGVDHVEVKSIWVVGHLACAPIRQPSGSYVTKQVEVPEKVEKVGSYYLATVINDRFLPDACKWIGDSYEIRLMHGNTLLATAGAAPNDFEKSDTRELTCVPPPDFPTCFLRSKEAFLRSHFKGVFNITVEEME